MTSNDYNVIKPVDSLQTISGLSPIKNREERKRRQSGQPNREQVKDQSQPDQSLLQSDDVELKGFAEYGEENKSVEDVLNKTTDSEDDAKKFTGKGDDKHSIDYCA
jgi:hypothetical protein